MKKIETIEHKSHNWWGYLLVLAGAYLLLNQIAPGWLRTDLFWPVVVILIGIYLVVRK